jgi:hypothetical protein
MNLVDLFAGAKLGGEAHDTQDATTRSLIWSGASDAYRNDRTDALSFYSFHERRCLKCYGVGGIQKAC